MLIQRPDAGRKLQRKYGLTGIPDTVLAPEIVPVTIVHDLSDEPTDDVARSCQGSIIVAAVAGQNGHAVLAQPTPRLGGPIQVEAVVVSSPTAGAIRIRRSVAATGFAALNTKSFTDFSQPGLPGAFLAGGTNAGLLAGTDVWRGHVLANNPTAVALSVSMLDPTPYVMVIHEGANAVLNAVYYWRELPLQG